VINSLNGAAEFCIDLLEKAGERFAGPIAILRNWTYCMFYVMAELWGSVVVSVLFWGFANAITTVDEAESFYPLFGLGANVALIFSGQVLSTFHSTRFSTIPLYSHLHMHSHTHPALCITLVVPHDVHVACCIAHLRSFRQEHTANYKGTFARCDAK
jgi:ATP/ADP translocase